ncbi:KEOPS complex subunit Cgi121 [Promethearchaeum syntrophicum]|uniref:KEOPS complex subunit Cgi121 n=1 Tax=Promethearchaeum syntrophicum TaxID=2594042 RepID=A0A5B9D6P3_9ARCH|nr:KEOPS complex subunit Cgi121 [Candidatus Prometheoarchaeum syntrophicum]QEE14457.1 Kinase binding protein CGI-121 [Candidatus Prometheoarchaeum syntrophicum]
MNIIEVEKGVAMSLAQYIGTVKDNPKHLKPTSYLDQFILLKQEIMEKFNISFQMFNSQFVISKDQLKFILHHVHSTFSLGSNISKQYGVEFLLYLSHEKQITKAIDKVGVKSPKEKKEISYGEILFGEPDDLQQAINFLETQTTNGKHAQFKYLEPNEWEPFMKTFEISITQITNILQGNNEPVKGKINSLDDLKREISSDSILKAITDAYNTGMVKLFLENFKRNVEK